MELVYLWVEDYKNIKKQGFNFSPRFECSYDEETKELTIDEKEDYLENFFGENINITAIVGENGSGKSSIIKLVETLFTKNNIKKGFLLLFFINDKLLIKSNITIKEINNDSNIQDDILDTNLFSVLTYYSEMPYPYEDRKKLHIESFKDFGTINMQQKNIYKLMAAMLQTEDTIILNKLKFIFTPIKMEVSINDEYKNNLLKYIHDTLNEDLIFKNIKANPFLQQKILPNQTELIDNIINSVYEDNGRYDNFLDHKAENEFNLDKNMYRNNYADETYQLSDDDILSELSTLYSEQFSQEDFIKDTFNQNEIHQQLLNELNSKLYAFFHNRISKINKSTHASKLNIFTIFLFYTVLENELLEEYLNFIIENYFACYPNVESTDLLIEMSFQDSEIDKISDFIKQYNPGFDYNYLDFKKLLALINNEIDYFNQYYEFFLFDFQDDNNKKFNSLSHGEKTFFGQIISIYHYSINTEHNNLLFCFDEPEISLHTKWQQKYLKKLIYAMKQTNKKICLIFTSHSPFLLSDLSKENVIFLDKVHDKTKEKYLNLNLDGLKNGNCINVSKEIELNPFGANIHTLLSHGFFMQNGLMGEFAKGKINQVYKFITEYDTSKIKTKQEAQEIINLVGEPLIKKQLQELFNEKFEPNDMTIDDEITLLKTKLDALKKIKND